MSNIKKSLSKKSIIRLCILGVVLFLCIGLVSGIQTYQQNLSVSEETAGSYAYMLAYEVSLYDIDQILANEKEICEIVAGEKAALYTQVQEYADQEPYIDLRSEYNEDQINAFNSWSFMESFVVGFGNICENMKYAYVVVPEEDELLYLWDSDMEDWENKKPFERVAYKGNEKEYILSIMSGEKYTDFFTDTIDGELIGTSLMAIYNDNDEIVAVAACDISISEIRAVTFKLLANIAIAILLIMLIAITIYHYAVRAQIIDPIVKLTDTADGLVNSLQNESGEPVKVDVHTGDELDVLARSFEKMDEKLLNYIRENTAITAEKERMSTELSLASRIQMDMLPRTFPPFPERKEIDLYASMKPAKDVGGDFYDFFLDEKERLWLVMADVSGKGIPAALFMMMSKIMVEIVAHITDNPGQVLEKVNDRICESNEEEMFVTVWLGVLDLKTGVLKAANAGHEYPILKAPDGDFVVYKDPHGLVVGGMEGCRYKEYEILLTPGSRLFVYTDGLPEATNADNELFGMERTVLSLNEIKDGTPKEVLEHMTQSVADYVGNAPQFDDTTMMCLDFYGCAEAETE